MAIQRETDKHGPRMADDLGKDTRAGHDEQRHMDPEADRDEVRPPPHHEMDEADVDARSRLAATLRPSAFPANRERLLEVARDEHAEDRVLLQLEALPPDRRFENVQEVWDALGGPREPRLHGG